MASAFGEMSIPAIIGALFSVSFAAMFPTLAVACFLGIVVISFIYVLLSFSIIFQGLICCVVSFILLRKLRRIDHTVLASHLVQDETFSSLEGDFDDEL